MHIFVYSKVQRIGLRMVWTVFLSEHKGAPLHHDPLTDCFWEGATAAPMDLSSIKPVILAIGGLNIGCFLPNMINIG